MATRCLQLIADFDDFEEPTSPMALAVRYAYRQWTTHVQQAAWIVEDDDAVYNFRRRHFLKWLHRLASDGELSLARRMIQSLREDFAVGPAN